MAQIGLRELTPATVAHILSMMSRSHVGLSEAVPVQVCVQNLYHIFINVLVKLWL